MRTQKRPVTCVLTGKVTNLTDEQYRKKLTYYGTDETIAKYFIINQIITQIKHGKSMEEISEELNFEYDSEKTDFYNDLISFHMRAQNAPKVKDESTTTQMETDSKVKDFICMWQTLNIE